MWLFSVKIVTFPRRRQRRYTTVIHDVSFRVQHITIVQIMPNVIITHNTIHHGSLPQNVRAHYTFIHGVGTHIIIISSSWRPGRIPTLSYYIVRRRISCRKTITHVRRHITPHIVHILFSCYVWAARLLSRPPEYNIISSACVGIHCNILLLHIYGCPGMNLANFPLVLTIFIPLRPVYILYLYLHAPRRSLVFSTVLRHKHMRCRYTMYIPRTVSFSSRYSCLRPAHRFSHERYKLQ